MNKREKLYNISFKQETCEDFPLLQLWACRILVYCSCVGEKQKKTVLFLTLKGLKLRLEVNGCVDPNFVKIGEWQMGTCKYKISSSNFL